MNIQKIKIISNNICYGPPPSPTDEVKQHLTISLTGRVWFTGYDYGEGYGKHKIGRSCQVSIGKTKAAYMLSLFQSFFPVRYMVCLSRILDHGK